MSKESENARKRYTQTVLSGWGTNVQSGKEGSSNSSSDNKTVGEVPAKFWEQKEHIVFVPVVIKQIELSDTEYKCEISIPLDVDVPVRVHRNRSEKMSQFTTYILKEKSRDNSPRLSMVSRISEERVDPLSPPSNDTVGEVLAYVYSRVLGIANRATKCIVFEHKDQKSKMDEASSKVAAQETKDLGKHKTGRRSEKVRRKIRNEEGAKDSSKMVSVDGKILGDRPQDGKD